VLRAKFDIYVVLNIGWQDISKCYP